MGIYKRREERRLLFETNDMSQLAQVHEIILECNMVFDHYIIFKRKDGTLLARIRVDPDESWDKLKEYHAKWTTAMNLDKELTGWDEK